MKTLIRLSAITLALIAAPIATHTSYQDAPREAAPSFLTTYEDEKPMSALDFVTWVKEEHPTQKQIIEVFDYRMIDSECDKIIEGMNDGHTLQSYIDSVTPLT